MHLQLRQTLISTGAVGAVLGSVLAAVSLLQYFDQGRLIAQGFAPTPFSTYLLWAGGLLFGSTLFCVALFGLFPYAIQVGAGWLWSVTRPRA